MAENRETAEDEIAATEHKDPEEKDISSSLCGLCSATSQIPSFLRKLSHHEGTEEHEVLDRPIWMVFLRALLPFVVKIGLRLPCCALPVRHSSSEIEFRGNSAPLFVYSVPFVVNIAPAIPHPHKFTDSLTRSFSYSSLILIFAFFSFRRFFLLIDLCLNRASMNDTCNRQSAQCGPVNTGPWLGDLSHRIRHSSHSSHWSHRLPDQASQTLDVRPRMRPVQPQTPCTAGTGNHSEKRQKMPDSTRKTKPKTRTNPEISGQIRLNPGKTGQKMKNQKTPGFGDSDQ
ncbi:MAG: hypothetical protein ABSH38_15440 [Verrucomicrobiota bacterium]